ncbi:MAG: NAD(P)H-dependent oxidoreductase [Acidobacteriota bacterium]|nr:NAD(P)H-dependent oxidoreductase [Acidobacteriota bacterium]
MSETIYVGIILGSTRVGRFCDVIANWAAAQVRADGRFQPILIDPASNNPDELRNLVGQASAYIVVTPEYNHGYPAPLKSLIDSIGPEWHAKPVAFVSYGGISGGLRAVEQLRQVFAELHAVTIRDSVSFASAWELFDSTGVLVSPDRPVRSMRAMLTRLGWWATALDQARTVRPYPQSA